MAGMQETDHITLKNGITYLLQDAKARAKLAELLVEVMEKYGADNPPPYPVTSVNGQTGDVDIPTVDLPLPISEGGHAATTAAQAAKNLGVLPLGEVVTKIPSGADLNDYGLPGVYAIGGNSTAATIANMPQQSAGTLRVFASSGAAITASSTWKYLRQEYITYTGERYQRYGESGSGTAVTWLAWNTIYTSANFNTPVPVSQGGTGAATAADARVNLGIWSVDYAQAQDISALTSLNGTFTAPDNGFIFGELVKDDDSADSQYELKVGNKIVVRYRVWPSNVFYSSFCIPIAKGETITVSRCTNMYFPESLYLPKFVAI